MPFSSTELDSPGFDSVEGSSRNEPIEGTDVLQARHVVIRSIAWQNGRSEVLERFHSEILALARLHHPHVERIQHLFRASDHYLTVLEKRQGEPLDGMLKRAGPVSWQTATSMMCQALDGLQNAHLHGVVHRDVRPSNLEVSSSGELKVCNFGVLRGPFADNAEFIGQFDGSLRYMAPEQVRGELGDCRIDIYSIGAVLYELLAGRPLFDQVSDYDLMLAVVRDEPLSLQTRNPAIPDRLQAAVMRAIAKSSRQRFQTAFEFRSELEAVLANEAVPARPEHLADIKRTAAGAHTPPSKPAVGRKAEIVYGAAVRNAFQLLQRRWSLSAPRFAVNRACATYASVALAVLVGAYALWPTKPLIAPATQIATQDISPATTISQDPSAILQAEPASGDGTGAYVASPSQEAAVSTASAEIAAVADLAALSVDQEPLIPSHEAEIVQVRPAPKSDMVASLATLTATESPKVTKAKTRVSYKEHRSNLRDGGWKIVSD